MRATQSLINQLSSDLNSTEDTQERVQEAVSQLRHTINSLTLQLAQVEPIQSNSHLAMYSYDVMLCHHKYGDSSRV